MHRQVVPETLYAEARICVYEEHVCAIINRPLEDVSDKGWEDMTTHSNRKVLTPPRKKVHKIPTDAGRNWEDGSSQGVSAENAASSSQTPASSADITIWSRPPGAEADGPFPPERLRIRTEDAANMVRFRAPGTGVAVVTKRG